MDDGSDQDRGASLRRDALALRGHCADPPPRKEPLAAAAVLLALTPATARTASDHLDAFLDAREIPVTVENFIRAATDSELGKDVGLASGVHRVYHFRDMMPVDNQMSIEAASSDPLIVPLHDEES